nr:hypothetical protein [Bacillus licheniformis]
MNWSHIYDTSMAPHMAISALSEFIFKKRFDFKVTPKGVNTDRRKFKYTTAAAVCDFARNDGACTRKNPL